MTGAAARPLVSVIVPTYQRADLLRLTIDSVLAQTWRPLELIVVDDGSTDGTAALLRGYGDRLRAICQTNRGGTAARNTGTRAARGAFLNWLDHDDVMLPSKIERQMALFRARPSLGLVHCGYFRVDRDGRRIDRVTALPAGDVRRRLVCGCFVWSGAPLVRRECVEQVGLFDESVWSSDAEFWLRIALAGWRWGCVQEPLGEYRILADSSMADVERTERLDVAILERVFADPRLPADARAMWRAAWFNQRFWLATRYYTTRQWADAERNLDEALRWRPQFLDDLDGMAAEIAGAALDPRVDDPIRFVRDMLDHLPPAAARIADARRRIVATAHLRVALRAFAQGRLDEGRRALGRAVGTDPELVARPGVIAASIDESARRAVGPKVDLVETTFANLPAGAEGLAAARASIVGRVHWTAAQRAWRIGARRAAVGHLAIAFGHEPRLVGWKARRVIRRVRAASMRVVRSAGVSRLEGGLRSEPPVVR